MLTPQEEVPNLAKALNLGVPLYLKREDLHPYKSHKGRSIPYMIESYAKGGQTHFAISSSGNAALAAALYIIDYNSQFTESQLSLQIFVGENISDSKYQTLKQLKLTNKNITLTQCEKPKQTVHKLNKSGEAKALRQSNDPLALVGYASLAEELNELGDVGGIFVPTSSGTTAEALAKRLPVHIVQTSSCHPISAIFDYDFAKSEVSLADAIVDKVALRQESLKNLVINGWVVDDNEISTAIKLVKSTTDLDLSPNSALSIAGLSKALKSGWLPIEKVVCLITGK